MFDSATTRSVGRGVCHSERSVPHVCTELMIAEEQTIAYISSMQVLLCRHVGWCRDTMHCRSVWNRFRRLSIWERGV